MKPPSNPHPPQTGAGDLAAACNGFGFRLLADLAGRDAGRNVLLSPLSLSLCLSLLNAGAAGGTRAAISGVLGVRAADAWRAGASDGAPGTLWPEARARAGLAVANGLFFNEGFRLSQAFLRAADSLPAADVVSLNFADPAAAAHINVWAREKTGGKIATVLDESDLGAATTLVLASALNFSGRWATSFDRGATKPGAFNLPGGERKNLPMMSAQVVCGYLRAEGFEAIHLPYAGGGLGFYVFLPSPGRGLAEMLDGFNSAEGEQWMRGLSDRVVSLSLPRYRVACEADLKGPLGRLGMDVAFTHHADFGPTGAPGIFVQQARHKTMMEVNEEGTEAAAVSTVIVERSLYGPPRVVVDRPFLLIVRDHASGVNLFVGIIAEPG